MSDPIRPGALFEQARVLAGFGAGKGKPRTINHRRAVSAAYYGLFHSILGHTVQHVFDSDRTAATDADRFRSMRFVDHEDVNKVAKWVSACADQSTPVAALPKNLPDKGVWELFSAETAPGQRVSAVPSSLRTVADAFPSLKDARHAADYDHLEAFPKATAVAFVSEAEGAWRALDANADDEYVRRFLALVAFKASRL